MGEKAPPASKHLVAKLSTARQCEGREGNRRGAIRSGRIQSAYSKDLRTDRNVTTDRQQQAQWVSG